MDIRQLRYFLAVAQEGQFTKAAGRLHMAQPPLSQQIRQLEGELGVVLFKRSGRHIELTDAGQVLAVRAEQILDLVGSAKRELGDLTQGRRGSVSVGAVSSCGAFLLPRYIRDFHEKYPDITFQVWEGNTYRIMDLVDKGIVDIGIVRTPFRLEVYHYILQPPGEPPDPMAAVYPGEWKPGIPEGPLTLDRLKGIPLIVLRRYEQIITDAFRKIGCEPDILCRGDDTRSLIAWAAAGVGVAVIPRPPANLVPYGRVHFREILDRSLETRTAVIWLKGAYLSAVTQNFIQSMGGPGAAGTEHPDTLRNG